MRLAVLQFRLPAVLLTCGVLMALLAGASVAVLPIQVAAVLLMLVAGVVAMTLNLRAAYLTVVALVTVLPISLSTTAGARLPLVSASRGLIAMLLIAAIACWLRGDLQLRTPPLRWAILIWLLAVAIGAVGSVDATASLLRLGSDTIELFLFAYAGYLILDGASLRRLFVVLIGAGAINAAIGLSDLLGLGLLQHLAASANASFDRSGNALVSSGDVRLGVSRIQGTFQHPTFLAASLVMVFPIAYTVALLGKSRGRTLAVIFLALCVPAVLLTGTRAAWLVAALSAVAVWAYWWPRGRSVRVHAYAVVALACGGALAVPQLVGRVTGLLGDLFNASSGSTTLTTGYRLFLLRRAWSAVEPHAWTGFGYGNFDRAGVGGYFHGLTVSLTSADSHVVRLLVEVGVVGLAAFALLICSTIWLQVTALRRAASPQAKALAFAMLVATTGFLLINLTVSAFAITQVAYLYWVLIAAAAVTLEDAVPLITITRVDEPETAAEGSPGRR